MSIRQANLEDVEKIAPLFEQYRSFYNQPMDTDATVDFLQQRLLKTESIIFIFEKNNVMLGFVQLYPSFSSVSLKRLWILNDLFVIPEARRQSVARLLLEHATLFAQSTQARGLTLKTAIDNTAAQGLYQALGWQRNDRYLSFDLILK